VFRVGEEVPRDVLMPGDLEDCLGGDALVDMEGHGVGDAPLLLPLPRPFQPRLVIAEGLLEALQLLRFQLPFSRCGDEVGNRVNPAGPVETQGRGGMGIVGPLDPLSPGDPSPDRQPRWCSSAQFPPCQFGLRFSMVQPPPFRKSLRQKDRSGAKGTAGKQREEGRRNSVYSSVTLLFSY